MSRPTSAPPKTTALPPSVRATARDVLEAFSYAVDTWTYVARAQHHVINFPVPRTETIGLRHFVAARDACRRARVTVTWGTAHFNFTVRLPRDGGGGASKKRSAPAGVQGEARLHKKQREDDGGGVGF